MSTANRFDELLEGIQSTIAFSTYIDWERPMKKNGSNSNYCHSIMLYPVSFNV